MVIIKKNDIIIFVKENSITYTICVKTVENKDISKLLWKNDDWNLNIILKYLFKYDISKRNFLKLLGYKEKDNLIGTRRVTNNYGKMIEGKSDFAKDIVKLSDNFIKKIIFNSNKIKLKRNKKIINDLKKKKNFSCQVCGFSFQKKKGGNYCEGAHILQLSKSKIDTEENMLILCPNHHKMLDFGTDTDKKYVLEKCNVKKDLIDKFFKMNI